MKIVKKICCVMLVLFMAMSMYGEILAAEPSISLPSSSEAYLKDYTRKRVITVYYDGYYAGKRIPEKQVVGVCTVYLGSYRSKTKIDSKNYDAILVKCNMEPYTIKDSNGKKYYGHSQYLRFKTTLNQHCSYQYNSPNNDTTGSDTYTFGISGNSKGSSVSGSVKIDSSHCLVTDSSRPTKNIFNISYDYKTTWLKVLCSNARKEALYGSTWQFAACEWTTNLDKYNVCLDVYAKFGLSTNKNGLNMGDDYMSDHTGLFIASFTKNMK